MKEHMEPSFERSRKAVAVTALAVLGSIGVGSCADQEQISWSLAVTCEEGSNPHITGPTGFRSTPLALDPSSDFAIDCRDADSFRTARPSVEVVEGPGAEGGNSTENTANVEITGINKRIKRVSPDIDVLPWDVGGTTEVRVRGVQVRHTEVISPTHG